MRASSAALLAVVLMSGCHNREREQRHSLETARKGYEGAQQAVRDGDLARAHEQFGAAQTVMLKLRRSTARPMEEDVGEGPVVFDRTAKAWQDAWEQAFGDLIEAELPNLRARTAKGELDWSAGRSFLTTYRRDLDAQWLAAVQDASKGQLDRLGETYFFECECRGADEVCDRLRATLTPKLARPLTLERTLTTETRAQAFGLVKATLELSGWKSYASVKDPERGEVYSLPTLLTLTLEVETRGKTSSWDGTTRLDARAEAPVNVAITELRSTENAQVKKLADSVLEQLAARAAQTLAP